MAFITRAFFKRTLNSTCPSPDLVSDLYYSFSGKAGEYKCLPAGDYSVQVLASSDDILPDDTLSQRFMESWIPGYAFQFEIYSCSTSICWFVQLDAPNEVELINNLKSFGG
jgi:hypothetical protein